MVYVVTALYSAKYLVVDLLELFSPAGRLQSILDQLDIGQDVEQFEGTTLHRFTTLIITPACWM